MNTPTSTHYSRFTVDILFVYRFLMLCRVFSVTFPPLDISPGVTSVVISVSLVVIAITSVVPILAIIAPAIVSVISRITVISIPVSPLIITVISIPVSPLIITVVGSVAIMVSIPRKVMSVESPSWLQKFTHGYT